MDVKSRKAYRYYVSKKCCRYLFLKKRNKNTNTSILLLKNTVLSAQWVETDKTLFLFKKKSGRGIFCVNMINLLVYIMFHNEPIKTKLKINLISSTDQKARIRLLSLATQVVSKLEIAQSDLRNVITIHIKRLKKWRIQDKAFWVE